MLRIFESKFESISPQDRAMYISDAEHGWRLDCDINEVCRGLRAALATERSMVKAQRLIIADLRQQTEVISTGGE